MLLCAANAHHVATHTAAAAGSALLLPLRYIWKRRSASAKCARRGGVVCVVWRAAGCLLLECCSRQCVLSHSSQL